MVETINIDDNIEEFEDILSFINEWENEIPYINQYTSGSTGPPKKIEIPKWKMEASAKMTGEFLKLEECTSSLLCISTKYIGGKMLVVRSLLYGLKIHIANTNSNPLKNLNTPIDFVAMVPLQVETTLRKNPEKLNLIKHLIIGGAPVSDELIEQIKDFDCKAYSTFGMTETVSHIALKELTSINEPYRAIGNTSFTTQNDCLVIQSPELGFPNLVSNDIVKLIDDKTFHWLGRADFVINSGGIKIHPEEVERKIKGVINNDDFIISQLPDSSLGNKVIFIGEEHLKSDDIQEKIEAVLDKYERPKAYYFIPYLIKTESGKINRIKTTESI